MIVGTLAVFAISLSAGRPDHLGHHDGRLAPPPDSPNCVSTQAEDRKFWIEPITYMGASADAMSTIKDVIGQFSSATIVSESDSYLHVEFRSPFFRFVDDVEFVVEPETNRIHFRSASRVGYSDLGANRDRMERFRELFNARSSSDRRELPATATP